MALAISDGAKDGARAEPMRPVPILAMANRIMDPSGRWYTTIWREFATLGDAERCRFCHDCERQAGDARCLKGFKGAISDAAAPTHGDAQRSLRVVDGPA